MTFYRLSNGWSCEGQSFASVRDCLKFAYHYWGVHVRCFFVRGEQKLDLA